MCDGFRGARREARVLLDVSPLAIPYNGTWRFTVEVLRALFESRIGFHAVSLRAIQMDALPDDVAHALPAVLVQSGHRMPEWRHLIWEAIWLARRSIRYDITICPYVSLANAVWGRRVVLTVHDTWCLEHHGNVFRSMILSALRKRSVMRAPHVLTVSEFSRRRISDIVRRQDARVISNGASYTLGRPCGLRIPCSIMYVGGYEGRKNVGFLVEALAEVRNELPPSWRLFLVGNVSNAVAGLVDELGLNEYVRMVGVLDGTQLESMYGSMRVLAFPSLYEGFGLPLVEAMASGTPVVALACSAIPEVVRDGGLLVAPNDRRAFGMAIATLLKDEREWCVRSGLAVARAREFTWDRMHAMFCAFMCEVVPDAVPLSVADGGMCLRD